MEVGDHDDADGDDGNDNDVDDYDNHNYDDDYVFSMKALMKLLCRIISHCKAMHLVGLQNNGGLKS